MAFSLEQVRQSARLLRRHKRFTALAILSLGVAIALNTTMYSVVDALISPKLDIFQPYRLYEAPYFGDYRGRVPIRERNEALQVLTFHAGAAGKRGSGAGSIIERGTRLRDARILTVTPNYFAVLGVRPSAGRLLSSADVASTPTAVVLSERMWRQLFPERDAYDTASVLVDGEPRTVVGLVPYESDFPGAYTDVWQVASSSALPDMPLTLFRLGPGVSHAQAVAELNTLNHRIMERSGDRLPHAGFRFRRWIRPKFHEWGFHMAIVGAVGAVLLIACANLANLQLARGVARTRELATRSAIGASRRAIVGQLVIESAWLALGGLVLGAILTAWGMRIVETSVPDTLAEYVTRPQTSWRVAVFAMGATAFCVLTVGLLPAIRLSRVDIDTLLKSGAGTGQSRKARRQYAYLLISEVALALALMCGAGLLIQAALSLYRFELPANYRHLAGSYVRINPTTGDVRSERTWSDVVLQRLTGDTTVVSAATSRTQRPSRRAVSVDDPGGVPRVFVTHQWGYTVVSPDYLRTLGIPILEGRDFSPGEFAEPQVIVDKATATYLWPGESPVDRLIKLDSSNVDAPWLTVVGVSAVQPDAWQLRGSQRDDPRPKLGRIWVLNADDTALVQSFSAAGSRCCTGFTLVARTRGDVRRLPGAIRRALKPLGPSVRHFYTAAYEDQSSIRVRRERHDFIAALFGVFALCAFGLAALGVYAIVSHTVA
ncbi:MAG: ABC transporter permease, partial [Gemmatimonadaceae bacterium]